MSDYTNTFETTQYTAPSRSGSEESININPRESWIQVCKRSISKTVMLGTFFGFFIGLLFGGIFINKHNCEEVSIATTTAPPNLRGNASLLIENGPACNAHGKLYNQTCYCDVGFIGNECDYKQKSQITAFCLEFFLGVFGSGYFYMGLNSLAIAQLLVLVGPIIILAAIGACCNKTLDCDSSAYSCIDVVWRLAFSVFWLISVILIGMNKLNDGNDKPLESW